MSALPPERPLAHVYDAAYASVPNWDIGRPQRPFVHLVESGYVRGPVLDLGCGTGELSLFVAQRGFNVLGIDISPVAIRQSREKARWRRIDAAFLVWDALYLDRLADAGFAFRTVLDSAMYHVLAAEERDRLVDGLGEIVPSGGRYCVLGDARTDDRSGYGITPGEVGARFEATGEWETEFGYRTMFERRHSSNRAYFVGLQRR
ncbi:class I SAM-dependent methyltransferase [Halogeometricum sp. S1BR25-6]|uniref:Class I SAM-dependent methyltransferase n=1 Tax=Halogeometricum salsisoli TaxID=2950536 RepID=A0ABU2GFH1_9EURY|nr:class I SAM-dependent methyltransferase [Halogeometricum sp. S1BR25-6]MDS0298944.1 class I SAM-dependent methyltransferase [Halogeometricum sp. S1BR25-6]